MEAFVKEYWRSIIWCFHDLVWADYRDRLHPHPTPCQYCLKCGTVILAVGP